MAGRSWGSTALRIRLNTRCLNTAGTTVIDLTGTTAPAGGQTVRYYGLPVIGFAAQTFQNDAIVVSGKTYLSTFGATLPHHEVKKVQ